jgi:hypothetical protein
MTAAGLCTEFAVRLLYAALVSWFVIVPFLFVPSAADGHPSFLALLLFMAMAMSAFFAPLAGFVGVVGTFLPGSEDQGTVDRAYWAVRGIVLLFCLSVLLYVAAAFGGPYSPYVAITMGAGIVGLSAMVVRRRSAVRSRGSYPSDPRPLRDDERRSLRKWTRRTAAALIAMAGASLAWGWAVAAVRESYGASRLGLNACAALVVTTAIVTGAIYLSGRCPRCRYRLGYEISLLPGPWCGRCGVPFRPL